MAPTFTFAAATLASLWIAYLAARPHRVAPSGLPQPADILLILVFMLTVATYGRVAFRLSRVTLALGILVALIIYAGLVNAAWSIVFGDLRRNHLETLYFIYNGIACFAVAMLYHRYGVRFVKWTLLGVFLSLTLEMLVVLTGTAAGV